MIRHGCFRREDKGSLFQAANLNTKKERDMQTPGERAFWAEWTANTKPRGGKQALCVREAVVAGEGMERRGRNELVKVSRTRLYRIWATWVLFLETWGLQRVLVKGVLWPGCLLKRWSILAAGGVYILGVGGHDWKLEGSVLVTYCCVTNYPNT